MKRINAYYAILAMVLPGVCACENVHEIEIGGAERELSVNSFPTAGDTVQYAYVATSFQDKVRGVKNAHLRCIINGSPVSESDVLMPAAQYYSKEYDDVMKIPFDAAISPGDVVRLEVGADGLYADMEAVAPKKAEVLSVDTVTIVPGQRNRSGAGRLRCSIKVKDIPGEKNYYRLVCLMKYRITADSVLSHSVLDEWMPGDIIQEGRISVDIDNSSEPVLNKGINVGPEGVLDGVLPNYYDNEYNIFTDDEFRDGEYRLNVDIPAVDALKTYGTPVVQGNSRWILGQKRTLIFRILSMNRDTYAYYDTYMFDRSEQSSSELIPYIPYPDNVSGGIGFLGILSATDYELELPYVEDLFGSRRYKR